MLVFQTNYQNEEFRKSRVEILQEANYFTPGKNKTEDKSRKYTTLNAF